MKTEWGREEFRRRKKTGEPKPIKEADPSGSRWLPQKNKNHVRTNVGSVQPEDPKAKETNQSSNCSTSACTSRRSAIGFILRNHRSRQDRKQHCAGCPGSWPGWVCQSSASTSWWWGSSSCPGQHGAPGLCHGSCHQRGQPRSGGSRRLVSTCTRVFVW